MPDKELKKLIQRWTEWLRTQRNYSSHTIQSYLSDLEIFLEYLAKEKVTVSDLKKILYLILDYPHKHYTFKHFEV